MILYAATTFLSAFLLFLVQPIIAKQIVPWFGGSAAVWTTCLVFFQVALLAGYAYCDVVVRRLDLRRQLVLHAALLVLSLVSLPIVPSLDWKPLGTENPILRILGMLAATIGLPYFLLSTTSPIVQSWLARALPGKNPYRLFALSNAASMTALLGYPFLLEPWIPTRMQALAWSAAYALFIVLCIATGWSAYRSTAKAGPQPAAPVAAPVPTASARPKKKSKARKESLPEAEAARAASMVGADKRAAPRAGTQATWAILAAAASLLLLAVTNHITQNIASIPLLWVVPLGIYLSTFILCFEGSGYYRRNAFLLALAVAIAVMGWAIASPKVEYELGLQIAVFFAGLFVACMFCHGELARSKPAPEYLTRFYLMVALGGAGGSTLVGVVAPLALPADFDLAFGLVLVASLLVWQVRRDAKRFRMLGIAATLAAIGCGGWQIEQYYRATISATRNFYGVLRVREAGEGDAHFRALIHGNIRHGTQYEKFPAYPTSYYAPTSGVGRLLSQRPGGFTPLRVGVIGLGIGTLAAYGLPGDTMRFYDINPDVLIAAQRDFTYLKGSRAKIELVVGDARLALEREPPQMFDVLVVDAFFGDAIPVHLLTDEAMDIYLRHLKPGGVLAVHVTNRFLDLVPVVAALADKHRLYALYVSDANVRERDYASDWMVLSRERASLERSKLTEAATAFERRPEWRLWTDDFNNLAQALKSLR